MREDVRMYLLSMRIIELNARHRSKSGVHNAKAEECTTPRIGSRNIEIKIGVGGLPRNQK